MARADRNVLIEQLNAKYTQKFHDLLHLSASEDARLRCLLELVIDEAIFLERWDELANTPPKGPSTLQLAFAAVQS